MNRGLKHERTQREIDIENRRKSVAANVMAGATYREIAEVLKVSKSTVAEDYKAIVTEWKKHYADKFDRFLFMQMRRYDVLINGVWADARNGDKSAIDRVIALMDRQNNIMQISKGAPITVEQQGMVFNILAMQPGQLPAVDYSENYSDGEFELTSESDTGGAGSMLKLS
jgi:hypothetical protein